MKLSEVKDKLKKELKESRSLSRSSRDINISLELEDRIHKLRRIQETCSLLEELTIYAGEPIEL